MNRLSTAFLQVVIVLFGMGVLAFLLWEPHLEGRNAHATVSEIYFNDPFLAYVYLASVPFFAALYQGIRVLGYARQNRIFSEPAMKALRTIRNCGLALTGLVAISAFFMIFDDPEDRPPGVMLRALFAFSSIVVVAAATTFERILRNAVDMKSENELTMGREGQHGNHHQY